MILRIFRHPVLVSILAAVAVACLCSCNVQYSSSYEPVTMTIATVRVPGSLPVYVAQNNGFFKKYGLNVALVNHPVGRLVVADVAAGKADAGSAADVAVTLGIMEKKKLVVPAAICIADSSNAIVARKDRGITRPADLAGKRIGVTKGTTAEYFLDTFLLLNRLPSGSVTRMYVPQNRLVSALTSGAVDAIASWNPITTNAAIAAGTSATVVLQVREYFDTFYLLAANDDFVRKNPAVVKRLLLALKDATDFIAEQPAAAADILRTYTDDKREKPLDGYRYDITLDQSLLIGLRNTLSWAGGAGYHDPGTINFINHLYLDGLLAIDPDLVTVLK